MRPAKDILKDIQLLVKMYQAGTLGGEKMPEDVHPRLPQGSRDLLHYFTLPMALNYQRNSYKLWEAATATYNDPQTMAVFNPTQSAAIKTEDLREKLLKHKLALQPNKHIQTWSTLCQTILELFDGDLRNLFNENKNSAQRILELLQITHKKQFPYLSGNKIANYWLYVIHSYTSFKLNDPQALSIAPDTHVIQASIKLNVIENTPEQTDRQYVAEQWENLLRGTGLAPIDVHTPLWLWSRGNFIPLPRD